jgi:DNA-binding beta-propeller fold protein YncE
MTRSLLAALLLGCPAPPPAATEITMAARPIATIPEPAREAGPAPDPRVVAIAGEDAVFDATSHRMLLAAEGVVAVDVETFASTVVSSTPATSAATGDGTLFTVDLAMLTLTTPTEATKLSAAPALVRWVLGEVWVTEPDASRVEVFASDGKRKATVTVGPGGLAVSPTRKTVYAGTVEMDATTHAVHRTFDAHCDRPRSVAVDDDTSTLFIACADGIRAIDLQTARVAGEARLDGVLDVAWSPARRHLYASSSTGTLTTLTSTLLAVRKRDAPKAPRCFATDDRSQVWICDPERGQVLVFRDDGA